MISTNNVELCSVREQCGFHYFFFRAMSNKTIIRFGFLTSGITSSIIQLANKPSERKKPLDYKRLDLVIDKYEIVQV